MRHVPFKGNIVISNLPDGFTGAALAALFDDFGLVLGAVIEQPQGDPARAPRGLVNLAPPKAVEAAIQSLNGQVIDAHHLKVRKAPEPPKRAPKAPGRAARPAFRRSSAGEPRRAEPLPHFPASPATVVRRAPIVERRSLSGAGIRRIRFFDESKTGQGEE